MSSKAEAINNLRGIIERSTKLLEAVEALPELPDYCHLWATDTKLRIHIPYNQSLLADLDQILSQETDYQHVGEDWHSENGDKFVDYSNGKTNLLITMRANSCQLQKIGEKVIEVYRPVNC